MILESDDGDGFAGRVTLDQIFRRIAERRPDAMALAERHGDKMRQLSFADVEQAVAVLASRLVALGLPQDSVVALQGGASIAQTIGLLAAGRAGFIPMLVPELWREMDLVPAIEGSGARALISFDAADGAADLHCRVAAEIFHVRFVCALGDDVPDGVVPLGDLASLAAGEIGRIPAYRAGNPAEHVAVLTWDTGPDGPYLVPRSHRALVAGGVSTLLAGRLDEATVLVSTLSLSSFAGLASSVVVWLLTGGALVFERPYATAPLLETLQRVQATNLLLPADVGGALAAEGLLDRMVGLRSALLLNRAPELVPTPWRSDTVAAIDITAWGEAAVLARRRDGSERRATVPTRNAAAAGSDPVAIALAGHRTLHGSLALAGAMVPRVAYPAAAGAGLPLIADGAYDTGWACHLEADGAAVVCDAPPRGIARIGGYRISLRDTEAKLAKLLDAPVEVAALPHRILGQRLVAAAETVVDAPPRDDMPLISLTTAMVRRTG